MIKLYKILRENVYFETSWRVVDMWCEKCNHETNNSICELCNSKTDPVVPTDIYWCGQCKVPIIKHRNEASKEICPLCAGKTKYMVADLRPVFPEERLLLEILLDKPLAFIKSSVWANNNRYASAEMPGLPRCSNPNKAPLTTMAIQSG